MIDINLVQQVPNKKIREDIVRVFYGLVPCDGKQRSIKSILDNDSHYRKLAERVDKMRGKNDGFEPIRPPRKRRK